MALLSFSAEAERQKNILSKGGTSMSKLKLHFYSVILMIVFVNSDNNLGYFAGMKFRLEMMESETGRPY